MRILSTDGVVETDVVDGREQSLVIGHWHAVDRVLGGDLRLIGDYRGRSAAGVELEANPQTITRWVKQGELDVEDPYAD